MNKQCPIIRDLLPSYIDGLCSDESKRFVEGHLAECAACTNEYTAMKADYAKADAGEADGAAVLQSMHKTYRSIRVRTLVIAVLVAVLVFVGLIGAYAFLQSYSIGIPGTEADLFSMAQSPSGDLYYMFGSSQYEYNGRSTRIRIVEEENALYYDLYRPIGRTKLSPEESAQQEARISVLNNPLAAFTIGARMENSRIYIQWDDGPLEIKKIYIGTEDDYRLVWQEGEEIPLLPTDPEMERNAVGKG